MAQPNPKYRDRNGDFCPFCFRHVDHPLAGAVDDVLTVTVNGVDTWAHEVCVPVRGRV